MEFTNEMLVRIDRIFALAVAAGRSSLYEHEVYQILELIGIAVPTFVLVEQPRQIDESLLKQFNHELIVKIVSPQIPHKQRFGGVKKVANGDPLFIQYVLERMRDEVLTWFPEEQPEIVGFLLVEYIPHTQALGYEVLYGVKEDPAFGPVLTLSKGGDDAEFFAKYYDPANLFLAPLDYQTALKMLSSLHIKYKFIEIGHLEYLEYMAETAALLAELAYRYSFVAPVKPKYYLKALDLNPLVMTSQKLIALDGFAEFELASDDQMLQPLNQMNLEKFFKPHGVAVVGVSGDLSRYSMGREIAHLLHDLGRTDLYFINLKGGTIEFDGQTYPLYPNLAALPAVVDLAVYAAPAQASVQFLREIAQTQIKAVILISGIPAEIEYAKFAAEIKQVLPADVRIIGPNCMGVYYAPDQTQPGLNTLFIDEKRLEVRGTPFSNTVFLTQSGALAVTAIDKFQNAGLFKAVVSFGNKLDLQITDLLAYFAQTEAVQVIALYLEGLAWGEGRRFFELARQVTKPMIVYKAGRTAAGARAAASHTASISGSYDVFRAACLQAGVILAENIDEYYDLMRIFSLVAQKVPAGNRVAGVVNAGFESTMGADELGSLIQAKLSEATITKLNQINKYGLVDTHSPFLDITPMADDQMYADFIEVLLQDEGVDCVFVAVVPHSNFLKTIPDTYQAPDSLANLLIKLSQKYAKPMVVSVNAGRYYQNFVALMEEHGLPVFGDIRAAIKSLDRFVAYHMNTKKNY